MRSKAETTARILTVMIGCVLALAIGMWVSGDVGAMRDKVEKDARGGVPDGFVCQSSEGNRMQALVFYDPNDPDNGAKAMVYVDRTGLYGDGLDRKFAFGWFFRGSTPNAAPRQGVGPHGGRVFRRGVFLRHRRGAHRDGGRHRHGA